MRRSTQDSTFAAFQDRVKITLRSHLGICLSSAEIYARCQGGDLACTRENFRQMFKALTDAAPDWLAWEKIGRGFYYWWAAVEQPLTLGCDELLNDVARILCNQPQRRFSIAELIEASSLDISWKTFRLRFKTAIEPELPVWMQAHSGRWGATYFQWRDDER